MAKTPKEPAIMAAVMALIRGLSDEETTKKILSCKIALDDVGIVLAEARKRIQLTAEYNRDEQLGLAIKRLNRIIELSLPEENDSSWGDGADPQTAIRAQIELNKLLKLHEVQAGSTGDPDDDLGENKSEQLTRVRDHLQPLFSELDDDYPIDELARIAADQLRTAKSGEN